MHRSSPEAWARLTPTRTAARFRGRARLAIGALTLLLAGGATAQPRCDVDGDGLVTDLDGVTVLRSAAALDTACTLPVCDSNGDGRITDTDGVHVLRAAAALASPCGAGGPAPVCGDGIRSGAEACDGTDAASCASGLCRANCTCAPATGGAAITDFVPAVRGPGGQPGVLRVGVAPVPGPGAPMTIDNLDGTGEVPPSGSGSASFDVAANGTARAAGTGGTTLLVRVRDDAGIVASDFYELPLATSTVDLDFDVGDLPGGTGFFLDFATDASGVVSVYETLQIAIICIIAEFQRCEGGARDGELCSSDPCESACNPRPCNEPECPGGECVFQFEPRF